MKDKENILDLFERETVTGMAEVEITMRVSADSPIEQLRDFSEKTFGEKLSNFDTVELARNLAEIMDQLCDKICSIRADAEEARDEIQYCRQAQFSDLHTGNSASALEEKISAMDELIGNLEQAESNIVRMWDRYRAPRN